MKDDVWIKFLSYDSLLIRVHQAAFNHTERQTPGIAAMLNKSNCFVTYLHFNTRQKQV